MHSRRNTVCVRRVRQDIGMCKREEVEPNSCSIVKAGTIASIVVTLNTASVLIQTGTL